MYLDKQYNRWEDYEKSRKNVIATLPCFMKNSVMATAFPGDNMVFILIQQIHTLSTAAVRQCEGRAGPGACDPSYPACRGVVGAFLETSLHEAWLRTENTKQSSTWRTGKTDTSLEVTTSSFCVWKYFLWDTYPTFYLHVLQVSVTDWQQQSTRHQSRSCVHLQD
jgi:hypothetical protein